MNFRHVYWGIVIIVFGVLSLGVTLGWLPNVSLWALIGPYFLIALGLWLLIRPRFPRHTGLSTSSDSIPLDGAQEARIKIEHGAGKLNISGGAKEGELLGGSFWGGLKKKATRSGTTLDLKLESAYEFGDDSQDWNLNLTGAVPLDLKLDTGASELVCDLTDLKVRKLDLDTGASSTRIKLPAKAGYTLVDIDAGAASVEMAVPEGVAASIRLETALMKNTIDEVRFPRTGERYETPGYETAENKVEIKIDSAVGSISIK
jgi:hypothetical protein